MFSGLSICSRGGVSPMLLLLMMLWISPRNVQNCSTSTSLYRDISPLSPTHGHVLENLFIRKHVRLASGCFASSGNTFYFSCCFWKQFCQQEYIPVGCVPSAAVAVSWGGGLSDGGLPGGICPGEGVSAWQGDVCLGRCTPPSPCGQNS